MIESEVRMIDLSDPHQEVKILLESRPGNETNIWVNVEGICRLRITNAPDSIVCIRDNRRTK